MPSCTEVDLQRFIESFDKYDKVFYKWLSTNDYLWSERKNLHQSGLVIPREHVDFFGVKEVSSINETYEFEIYWFLKGKIYTRRDVKYTRSDYATLKYYIGGNRKSRPEVHLTNVYLPYFTGLKAPLLLLGRIPQGVGYTFNAIILDKDDLIEEFVTQVDMPEGALWGTLSVTNSQTTMEINIAEDLISILLQYARELFEKYGKIPSTEITAKLIWKIFSEQGSLIKEEFSVKGLAQSNNPLNTLLTRTPGDLTRWALTKVEYQLIKNLEQLYYSPQIVDHLKKVESRYPVNWLELEQQIKQTFDDLVKTFVGITNSRRSRAGYSFEWHIDHLLKLSNVKFERQVGDKRIDFKIHTKSRHINLSAKTSTRERWKQIYDGSYFITLERRIAKEKLEKIREKNITIIVPEKDIKDITLYKDYDHIITFKQFLQREIYK